MNLSRAFVRASLVALCAAAVSAHAQHAPSSRPAMPGLLESAGAGLVERDGTVSWKALAEVSTVQRENLDGRYGRGVAYFAEPVVAARVKELVGTTVRVKGYALPRNSRGEGEARMLVSAFPAADEDGCAAGGAPSRVDVRLASGRRPAIDKLVTVEGRLALFDAQRWDGYIYRLNDARIVEEQ